MADAVTGHLASTQDDQVVRAQGTIVLPALLDLAVVFPTQTTKEQVVSEVWEVRTRYPTLDNMTYSVSINGEKLPECDDWDSMAMEIAIWFRDRNYDGPERDPAG